MAISLLSLEAKHERRIRLVFSNTLDAGAFGIPGPAYYVITSNDAKGPNPTVAAAMVVSGSPNVVELALSAALVVGGQYNVSAVGVPATDLSVTPVGSELTLQFGFSARKENVEPIKQDRDRLLYGIDLVWSGKDYVETADGDLDRVSGTPNVLKALNRGLESPGLPWDDSWGGKLREFVDSPSVANTPMRGSVSSQILRDPRVASVKVSLEFEDDNTYLTADAKLVSGEPLERVTVEVPQ